MITSARSRSVRRVAVTFWRSGTLLIAALAGLLLMAGAALSGSFEHYPDLIAEAPGAPHLEVDTWPVGDPADPADCIAVGHSGDCRLLMQFDGFVTNVGDGPIHVEGNPQLSGGVAGQVAQMILDDDDNPIATFYLETAGANPAIKYETTDEHLHWHLMKIIEYSLWDETQTVQVTGGDKIGFCLYDVSRIGSEGPENPVYFGGGNFCAADGMSGGGPGATFLEMGTSEGWRDVYSFTINLQWIDVTDVAPGRYYLAGRADPEGFVVESDETNNGYVFSETFATVPGHTAQATSELADITLVNDIDVDLVVETYVASIDEDPSDGGQTNVLYPKGTREFTVESLPAHGTLTQGGFPVTVGTPFTDATLNYEPDGGYLGHDSFTFSAADSDSAYPLNPVIATVSITVDDNTPPVIFNPGPQTSTAGSGTILGLSVTDPNGDTPTVSADGLPPGIDVSGSLLIGTPVIPGSYDVTVTADDGNGGVSVEVFTWTIDGLLVLPFADVSAGHIFAADITWMHVMGISLGCGDGTNYCPDDFVTREQIASFIARAFELTAGAGDDLFTDDDGSVHEDNIDAVATAGVSNGCAVGLFCPIDNLTRAQFASLLIRALENLSGEDYSAAVGADYFTDDDGLLHEPNIDKLRYADITRGCGVGLYCPLDTLTRGQLAALLYRALG